jgi:hypothetical protein
MGARSLPRMPLSGLLAAAILAAAVVVPSCSDPVHDQEVQALGPENPAIPKGEYHRAGQPCTVCHGPEGPAQTQFSVAGTIFWNPYQTGAVGANNATVSLVDSLGSTFEIATNCVGNFWVSPSLYSPAFPMLASIGIQGQPTSSMFTQISRSGSCATCHADPPNYDAVGHVYLSVGAPPVADTDCPVDPNLADETAPGVP